MNQILSKLHVALTLCSLLVLSCVWSQAQAAPLSNAVNLNYVHDVFFNEALRCYLLIKTVSSNLLYYATCFAIVLLGIALLFRRNIDFNAFYRAMIYMILMLGFLRFVIQYGYTFSKDVINSFMMIPFVGTSHVPNNLSDIFDSFFKLVESFTYILVTKSSLIFVVFLLANYVLLSLFVIKYLLTYLSSILVTLFGVILLGLGTLRVTRHLPYSYFMTILSLGLELLTLTFIFQVGQTLIFNLLNAMQNQLAAGQLIRLQEISLVTFVLLLLVMLSYALPPKISGLLKRF